MKPGSLRPALLAVAVLLAAGPAWAAIPLKELTQEKLRDGVAAAVKASRDDPKWAETWKELDGLIVVDPEKIVYEHDKGVPVRVIWESKSKRDLNREERQKAAKDLRKVFNRALRQPEKGLLSEDDARLLESVARFPLVAELKTRPLKELTEDHVRDWVAEAVRATRKDPTWADAWKEMDRLVLVDPEEIFYEQDKGKPVKLVWEVHPRRPLTAEQRGKAQEDLKKLFSYVLFEHNKGLVPAEEMEVLKAVHKVEIKPNPAPRPRPEKLPPTTPVKDLTEDTVRDWMVVSAEKSRKDPDFVEIWKELDPLVEIDPNEIIYEHDKGAPTKLHWEVTPKRPLTAEERLKVKTDVDKLLQAMLFEHDKGLVPAEETEVVKDVAQVEVGPNPEAPPVVVNPPDNPTEIEKVKKTLDEMKVEADKAKKDRADAQAEIDKLKKDHAADQAEIEKLKKQPPEAQVEIDKVKKERADAQAEIEKLKKQQTDAQVEIDKAKKDREDAQAEVDKLKKRQAEAQVEIDKAKKERAEAQVEIDKAKKERAESLTEIEKLRIDIDKAKSARADAEADIERAKKERAESLTEIEKLHKEVADYRSEIEKIRAAGPERPPVGPTGSTGGGEPRGYIMVVQPSSMIYYDCASHCWLPGPASVVYYPAGAAAARRTERAELPRPPAFVAPLPRPASGLPLPEQPRPVLEKPEDSSEGAVRAFWIGYRSYWQGDYDRALASFDSAVGLEDQDARFWYYKALAERALGEVEKAEASAKRGRELHAALKPKADLVGAALERVQGQERRFLNAPEAVISAAKDGQ